MVQGCRSNKCTPGKYKSRGAAKTEKLKRTEGQSSQFLKRLVLLLICGEDRVKVIVYDRDGC